MLTLRSTKSYYKLPVAHLQWFSEDDSGAQFSGPCAKWHGYDRTVHFEFSGTPDDHGWLVGFGDLKQVKAWLEYYFDHTAIAPADDPRMDDIQAASDAGLVDLRILPYGVSMEMSSLFIWEQVNPFIHKITDGRCWVSRVECCEHDANSGIFEADQSLGLLQGQKNVDQCLVMKPVWKWVAPKHCLQYLEDYATFHSDRFNTIVGASMVGNA